MSEHSHTTIIPGCYRCDLNRDEVVDSATDTIKEALREYVGDGDGADESILQIHDQAVAAKAIASLARDIKNIHKPIDGGEHGPDECWEDVEKWPCQTIEAVRKAEGHG